MKTVNPALNPYQQKISRTLLFWHRGDYDHKDATIELLKMSRNELVDFIILCKNTGVFDKELELVQKTFKL